MANKLELPPEVIANIYKYMKGKDIRASQLTCHTWLNASQLISFEDTTVLKFTLLNETITKLFRESFRTFEKIHLFKKSANNLFKYEDLIDFFSIPRMSSNIKHLILEDFGSTITVKMLYKLLSLLPRLQTLECFGTNFSDFGGTICLKAGKIKALNSFNLLQYFLPATFKCLTFDSNENLQSFFQIKNLQKLIIKNTLSYSNPNELIYAMRQLIKNNESSLKSLYVTLTFIFGYQTIHYESCSEQYLESLITCQSTLKLQDFFLTTRGIKWPSIVNFLKTQNSITELSLIQCSLEDTQIVEILKYLPLLENLNVENNNSITNVAMLEFLRLKNLMYLNINATKITSDVIINNLDKDVHYQIIELKCLRIQLNNEACIKISEYLKHLQVFHCENISLNDFVIQSIIENCKNLIDLSLESQTISDYGITGIELETKEKTGHSISELEKLTRLNLQCGEIFDISDQTFEHGLKFKHLIELHITASLRVTPEAIEIFTKNCSKIKWIVLLEFSARENIYRIVEIILKNLKELTKMHIKGYCRLCEDYQEISLVKYRKELYTISTNCECKEWLNTGILCENFVTSK